MIQSIRSKFLYVAFSNRETVTTFAENAPHQPFKTRLVEAGYFSSNAAGRIGRFSKFPPQFGQMPPSGPSTQAGQKVHSNVQMRASASGGKSASHRSQFGRSSNIAITKFSDRFSPSPKERLLTPYRSADV